jgi:hypothetical protein
MRFFASLSLLALFAAAPACASRDIAGGSPSQLDPVSQQAITIVLEAPGGGALPSAFHGGATYFAGETGQRYNVRLTNNTGQRLEAVVTVDGRDVVSGELGNFKKQRGYIIEPFGTVVIDGFRQSLDHVAAFRFTEFHDSYSARRGTPQHTGVVGIAVFSEKARGGKNKPLAAGPSPFPGDRGGAGAGATVATPADADEARSEEHAARKSSAEPGGAPSPSAPAAESEGAADSAPATAGRDVGGGGNFAPPPEVRNELGTQYGETTASAVHEVDFKRKHKRKPDAIIAVFYDSAQGLASRGIDVGAGFAVQPHHDQPDAFPGSR